MELDIGSIIIIDGLAWSVASFHGEATARAVNEDSGKAIWFDRREAKVLGAGLWSLPGRIEPPKVDPTASVTASVAVADAGLSR